MKSNALLVTLVVSALCLHPSVSLADNLRHWGGLCHGWGVESDSCTYRDAGGIFNNCSNQEIDLTCPLNETYGTDAGTVYVHIWDGHSSSALCVSMIAHSSSGWQWSSSSSSCSTGTGSQTLSISRIANSDARYDWYTVSATVPRDQSGSTSYVYGYRN